MWVQIIGMAAVPRALWLCFSCCYHKANECCVFFRLVNFSSYAAYLSGYGLG